MKHKFFKYVDDGKGTIKSLLDAKTGLYSEIIFHEDVIPAQYVQSGAKYGFVEIDDKYSDSRVNDCARIAVDLCGSKGLVCMDSVTFFSELLTQTTYPESSPATYTLDGKEISLIN